MENNKVKYCPKCGSENNYEFDYCSKCGAKLSGNAHKEIANRNFNGFAVAGFIMSLLAWLLDYTTTLYDIDFFLGIIFCFVGSHYTKNGEQKGHGLAVIGIVSYILVFIVIVFTSQASYY